jgi:hypothetical protein
MRPRPQPMPSSLLWERVKPVQLKTYGTLRFGLSRTLVQTSLTKQKIAANVPLPDHLYCSPLTRALKTNALTFEGIVDRAERRTTVVEV